MALYFDNVVWGYFTGWAGGNLLAKVCLWLDLERGQPNFGWVRQDDGCLLFVVGNNFLTGFTEFTG